MIFCLISLYAVWIQNNSMDCSLLASWPWHIPTQAAIYILLFITCSTFFLLKWKLCSFLVDDWHAMQYLCSIQGSVLVPNFTECFTIADFGKQKARASNADSLSDFSWPRKNVIAAKLLVKDVVALRVHVLHFLWLLLLPLSRILLSLWRRFQLIFVPCRDSPKGSLKLPKSFAGKCTNCWIKGLPLNISKTRPCSDGFHQLWVKTG